MKRLIFAGLAVLALSVAAPKVSEAQVRVSVNLGGPRYGYGYGYGHRVYAYTPRAYYGGGYRYAYRGYHYARPRVEVVRVYRPRPVVVYRSQRGYRGYRYHR